MSFIVKFYPKYTMRSTQKKFLNFAGASYSLNTEHGPASCAADELHGEAQAKASDPKSGDGNPAGAERDSGRTRCKLLKRGFDNGLVAPQ